VRLDLEPACKAGDPKLETITHLLRHRFGRPKSILVIGCGDGTEAAELADRMEAIVVGVDIVDAFHVSAVNRVELRVADATELPFDDGSFDLVFSFHMLEHVSVPIQALAEMRRVVRPSGGFWVGTPNRSRLVGYVGGRGASLRDKITWNVVDWRARLTGRFRNELGAHAGFTQGELRDMLRTWFSVVEDESPAYYALLHQRYKPALGLIDHSGIGRFIYPSIYFAGRP